MTINSIRNINEKDYAESCIYAAIISRWKGSIRKCDERKTTRIYYPYGNAGEGICTSYVELKIVILYPTVGLVNASQIFISEIKLTTSQMQL